MLTTCLQTTVLTLCVSLQLVTSYSLRETLYNQQNLTDPQSQNTGVQIREWNVCRGGDFWVDWPCIAVNCSPLGSCSKAEVLVCRSGSRYCQGCPYCVDPPPRPRYRGRPRSSDSGRTGTGSRRGQRSSS